jgi:hypothetical protein
MGVPAEAVPDRHDKVYKVSGGQARKGTPGNPLQLAVNLGVDESLLVSGEVAQSLSAPPMWWGFFAFVLA